MISLLMFMKNYATYIFITLLLILLNIFIFFCLRKIYQKKQKAKVYNLEKARAILENTTDPILFMQNIKLRYTSQNFTYEQCKFEWFTTVMHEHVNRFVMFNDLQSAELQFMIIKTLLDHRIKEKTLYKVIINFLVDLILNKRFDLKLNIDLFDEELYAVYNQIYLHKQKMRNRNIQKIVTEYEYRVFLRDYKIEYNPL